MSTVVYLARSGGLYRSTLWKCPSSTGSPALLSLRLQPMIWDYEKLDETGIWMIINAFETTQAVIYFVLCNVLWASHRFYNFNDSKTYQWLNLLFGIAALSCSKEPRCNIAPDLLNRILWVSFHHSRIFSKTIESYLNFCHTSPWFALLFRHTAVLKDLLI